MRTTIHEALERIDAYEQGYSRIPTPARLVRVEPDGLVVDGAKVTLGGDGLRRFCASVGAPSGYLASLGRDLRARVLQHHLDRGKPAEFVEVICRGGVFCGFAEAGLLRLRGLEVVGAVAEALPDDAGAFVEELRISDDKLEIDILGDAVTEAILPGDVVAAGIRVTDFQFGVGATRIETYLLRRLCENGMTHRDHVGLTRTRRLPVHHPKARELQLEQVRRLAGGAWSTLRAKLAVLRELQGEQVNVERLLASWIRRGGLSERRLLAALRAAWDVEGGESTVYAAVNALTRVATHSVQLPQRQRQILSGLAGVLAFRRLHLCPRCFSLVRTPTHSSNEGGA